MFEIIKWLSIALLGAVAVGSIIGVAWGRYRLKKERGELHPVLSTVERILCAGSLAVGLALVLFAVFYNPTPAEDLVDGDGEGEYWGEEDWAADDVMLANPDFGGDGFDMDDGEAFLDDQENWDGEEPLPEDGEGDSLEDADAADPDADAEGDEEAAEPAAAAATPRSSGSTRSSGGSARSSGGGVVVVYG